MDQAVVSILVEGAKIATQSYFNYMRLAGKTPEEIDAMYEEEKKRFMENDPADLPDI
jgi:hypothetical protein